MVVRAVTVISSVLGQKKHPGFKNQSWALGVDSIRQSEYRNLGYLAYTEIKTAKDC